MIIINILGDKILKLNTLKLRDIHLVALESFNLCVYAIMVDDDKKNKTISGCTFIKYLPM